MRSFSTGVFRRNQGVELGVGGEDVLGDGAHDIDPEVMVFGVLEGSGDEFESEAASAEFFGDFGVPDRHPAMAVGFEFEVAGLAVLFDLEAAAGYGGGVGHGGSLIRIAGTWEAAFRLRWVANEERRLFLAAGAIDSLRAEILDDADSSFRYGGPFGSAPGSTESSLRRVAQDEVCVWRKGAGAKAHSFKIGFGTTEVMP